MTTDTQNYQAIRGFLDNALQQVLATQTQVKAIESQMREIKSQIDLSLEAIDPVLKQLETLEAGEHHAEKVRNDMAATLCEMFEHVSSIVNNARDQVLNTRSDETNTEDVNPHVKEAVLETTREALAEIVPDESTPLEPQSAETLSAKSLTGSQVGQRVTESLNEMIATIDETNAETDTLQEQEEELEPEAEAEIESQTVSPQEQETESVPQVETVALEPDSVAADLTMLDDEEDAQTVNELLKTTSGSFDTQ